MEEVIAINAQIVHIQNAQLVKEPCIESPMENIIAPLVVLKKIKVTKMSKLRALMESRMVEIELPTKEVLIIHAASILSSNKDRLMGVIRKRIGPIAHKIDAEKVTKENEKQIVKIPMSEADVLFLHSYTAFADNRLSFPRWVKKWITPTALKILEERKEYN